MGKISQKYRMEGIWMVSLPFIQSWNSIYNILGKWSFTFPFENFQWQDIHYFLRQLIHFWTALILGSFLLIANQSLFPCMYLLPISPSSALLGPSRVKSYPFFPWQLFRELTCLLVFSFQVKISLPPFIWHDCIPQLSCLPDSKCSQAC